MAPRRRATSESRSRRDGKNRSWRSYPQTQRASTQTTKACNENAVNIYRARSRGRVTGRSSVRRRRFASRSKKSASSSSVNICMSETFRNPEDHARRSATLKRRTATAKAHAAAEKKWSHDVTAAAVGTMWRVTASWIEQSDRSCCAELTNVSTGSVRVLRLKETDSVEACRARILAV